MKKSYMFEELVTDDSFIRYALEKDAADIRQWEQFIAHHPSQAATIREAREWVLALTAAIREKQLQDPEQAFEELLATAPSGIGHDTVILPMHSRPRSRTRLRIAVYGAAAVLLLAGGVLFLREKNNRRGIPPPGISSRKDMARFTTYRSPADIRRVLTLPDSTRVTLNANSCLKVPADYNKSERKLMLEGAAFFEVAADAGKPFEVSSDNLSVDVLGTSFYFRAYAHEHREEVKLVTGKVKVASSGDSLTGKKENVLAPGKMIDLDKGDHAIREKGFDIDALMNWKANRLVFDNADVRTFVRQMERWYGITLEVKAKSRPSARFNGTYERAALEEVLQTYCFATESQYEIRDGKVIIWF
ncbi:FecR family protein [Compostibacter hankyongensis]|uniref:FecR family protein n=1 Tax=Compostibacter hankyongensis TaxID=1007089 RepID=A0ABP8FVT4_9BACT